MQRRRWWHRPIGVLLLLILATSSVRADEPDLPLMLGASSDEHLWFVVAGEELGIDNAPDGFALCHHARSMSGPHYRPMMELPRMPVAMAAADRRAWLVFDANSSSLRRQYEVYTIEARPHPMHGGYYPVPHDRLRIVAPLPGGVQLNGIVATDRGPIALVTPEASDEAGPDAATDAAAGPQLLRLMSGRWQPVDLPEGFACDDCRLTAAGENGELIWIVGRGAGGGTANVHQREIDGGWSRFTVELDPDRLITLQRVGNQVAAVVEVERERTVRVEYVRPNEMLELARVDRPQRSSMFLGMADGMQLIALAEEDGLTSRRLDGLSGVVGSERQLTLQPIDTMSSLRVPVALAIAVFALIMIVVLRPTAGDPVNLPEGTTITPPLMRLGAVLIDMLPGAVLSVLILDVRPIELLGLPLMTFTFDDSLPYIVMAVITMAHSLPTEVLAHRTLGKAILGGKVVSTDGERPMALRLLVRNLVKTVIVLVPPLGVIVLVNPNRQGLNDLAGRTVVVAPPEPTDDGGSGGEET